MEFDFMNFFNNDSIYGAGYVIIISSIISILIVLLIKKILEKKNKLEKLDSTQIDYVMSRVGRYVVLIVYTLTYIINEFILKRTITFNGDLITLLVGGAAIALTTTKGIYTYFHQLNKSKNIYELLKTSEEKLEDSKSSDGNTTKDNVIDYILGNDNDSK